MSGPRYRARPWTALEEERLRASIISGMSVAEISIDFQRSISAVRSRSEQLGITLKRVMVRSKH
jgi:hypothetical protein